MNKYGLLKDSIIVVFLIISIILNYYCHFILKIEILYSHFFYIPIILASLWWHRKGFIIAIVIGIIYLSFHFYAPFSNLSWYYMNHIIRVLLLCIVSIVIGEISYRRIKAENEIKKNARELEKALASLKELDRTKSVFISIAAHELRTPLQPIRVYFDLMMNDRLGKFSDEEKMKLIYIDRSLRRLVQIISTLLDLSAIEEGKYRIHIEKKNIQKIINNSINDMKPLIDGKKISVTSDVPKLFVRCDPLAIDRVLKNLISNAIKYNRKRGKIEIKVWDEKKDIHVCVKDTGIGIRKQDFDGIFKRFYIIDNKLARDSERLGIGLFVTKHIIELHNGKIWVESVKGKGSTFHFTIPKV